MTLQTIARPEPGEYRDYYATYVDLVPDGDLVSLLAGQITELHEVLDPLTEAQAMTVHAPFTWHIKQVVGHLIDVERIFGNRLHRFSANDLQAVPGMDHHIYVANQDSGSVTLASLVRELECCRDANLLLLSRIRPSAWDLQAEADGHPVSVRAIAWILAGHVIHHLQIIRQRLAGEP